MDVEAVLPHGRQHHLADRVGRDAASEHVGQAPGAILSQVALGAGGQGRLAPGLHPPGAGDDVGGHRPRAEHGAADPERLQLGAQGLRQANHRELGSVVENPASGRHQARARGGVDDLPAAAALGHARQEGLHAVDHAAEVDPHAPVPQLVGQLRRRRGPGDAGIVDQQRDWPELGFGRVGDARVGFAVAHVERVCLRGRSRRELRLGSSEGGGVEVDERQLRAGAGEGPRDAEANAVAPAGDERRPPGHFGHKCVSHCLVGGLVGGEGFEPPTSWV